MEKKDKFKKSDEVVTIAGYGTKHRIGKIIKVTKKLGKLWVLYSGSQKPEYAGTVENPRVEIDNFLYSAIKIREAREFRGHVPNKEASSHKQPSAFMK